MFMVFGHDTGLNATVDGFDKRNRICMIRVRVLGTDYCSPWARELTRALLPGDGLFAAAAAAAAAHLWPSNLTSSRTYI